LAVEDARAKVAAILGAEPKEIIWTSGATESNNLAILGVAHAYKEKGRHLISQVTEHNAVLDPLQQLEKEGFEVTYLPVNKAGRVDPAAVTAAIRSDTILVSLMWANNETGVLQPVNDVGAICRSRGIPFHTDATQAVGKIPVDINASQIDLLSLSAHKLYGPKGCGALFVRSRPRVRLAPLVYGGGHERGFRSGTLNVPGIVGLGAACEIAQMEMNAESIRLRSLRDRLEASICATVDHVTINGVGAERLSHVSNLTFHNVEGESLLLALDDLALSSGSACTSAKMEASHVLRAMGLGEEDAFSSIRFSLGRLTTEDDLEYVVQRIGQAVRHLRQFRPSLA
jgi:cysteine desulfurase